MDPYSAEGELVNIHNAYHQGQHQKVLDLDTTSFSSSNALPARILKLRAKIALGQYNQVLSETKSQPNNPDLAALHALASYLKDPGNSDAALSSARSFAEKHGDNLTVQLCCGTVLANAGATDEALALLAKHQGSLDAVALIVQIHLQQNRVDLAAKEAKNARGWAQDALVVNLVESWVGLREGGDKYQQAYYVFEELAQASATQSVQALVGQAVSEIHLGRLPEAEAALQQARDLDADNADVLANTIVLNTIMGNDTAEYRSQLESVAPKHQMLEDIAAKKQAFDAACAKYNPKFEP